MTRLRTISIFVVITVLLGAAPAQAAIRIKRIEFNPPGDDTGSNERLNREYILFKNTGTRVKDISGWKVFDAGRDHTYVFDPVRVGAGKTVKLMTGQGKDLAITDGSYILYWNLDNYVWNNDGDKATLKNKAKGVVDRCGYTASADSPVAC